MKPGIDIYCSVFSLSDNDTLLSSRAVWKVRGLTLLLRVGTLWRCGDGLFFEVSPLAIDALLTTLHPLLENVLQTVDHFETSCLGSPFSWWEKFKHHMGRDLNWILCSACKKVDRWNPIRTSAISPHEISGPFQPWKGSSETRNATLFREVGGAL
jgi:hypothetical protein